MTVPAGSVGRVDPVAYFWIGWLILIVLFVTIEVATAEFTFLMLAIGSLAGLVAELLGAPWWLQIPIAAIVALLGVFLVRPPLLRALRRGADPAKSNIDAVIGQAGRVLLPVTPTGGQVKLANGETWTARLAPGASASTLDPDSPVTVTAIDGASVVVAPA